MFHLLVLLFVSIEAKALPRDYQMIGSRIASTLAEGLKLRGDEHRVVHSQEHQACMDRYEEVKALLDDTEKRPDCVQQKEAIDFLNNACLDETESACLNNNCSWYEGQCYLTGDISQRALVDVCTNPCYKDSIANLRTVSDCVSKILGPESVLEVENTLANQRLYCAHRDPNKFCLAAMHDIEPAAGVCYQIADLGCCYKELLLANYNDLNGSDQCQTGLLESCGDPFQDHYYVTGVLVIEGVNASYYESNKEVILLGVREELAKQLDIPVGRIAISGESAYDVDNTLTVPYTIYAYSEEDQRKSQEQIDEIMAGSGFSFPLLEAGGGVVNPSRSSTSTSIVGGIVSLFTSPASTTIAPWSSLLVSFFFSLSLSRFA